MTRRELFRAIVGGAGAVAVTAARAAPFEAVPVETPTVEREWTTTYRVLTYDGRVITWDREGVWG